MSLLTPEQIESSLSKLPLNWAVVGGVALQTTLVFDSFMDGLNFVQNVAKEAEELQHHPDIELSYGKVVVSITTHDKNGLTHKDFELAKKISSIKV